MVKALTTVWPTHQDRSRSGGTRKLVDESYQEGAWVLVVTVRLVFFSSVAFEESSVRGELAEMRSWRRR
jgi:hypothetical protein